MINNQSDTPEKLIPQDSDQKEIDHPADDKEAVVKKKDRKYDGKSANFGDVAKKKENSDVRNT